MTDTNIEQLTELARQAARDAGDYLIDQQPQVNAHLGRDIKLVQDTAAEAIILRSLSSSALPALAEEGGGVALGSEKCWVIDPLDGTYNYFRGMRDCAVCIGLWEQDAPQMGVVYLFQFDRMYSGAPNSAALCNGEAIHTSDITQLSEAVLTTGFPARTEFSPQAIAKRARPWCAFRKIRMCGSAATAMTYVAHGICDVYAEYDIMPWDVCAGIALVQAAGGCCTYGPAASGNEGAWDIVAAANASLLEQYLQVRDSR